MCWLLPTAFLTSYIGDTPNEQQAVMEDCIVAVYHLYASTGGRRDNVACGSKANLFGYSCENQIPLEQTG